MKKLYSDIDSQRSRVLARSIPRKKGEKISLKQYELLVFDFFFRQERKCELHYLLDCMCQIEVLPVRCESEDFYNVECVDVLTQVKFRGRDRHTI